MNDVTLTSFFNDEDSNSDYLKKAAVQFWYLKVESGSNKTTD